MRTPQVVASQSEGCSCGSGALGTIPKALEKHLKEIRTSVRVELLQKAALLGTARILRKTLEI